MTALLPLYIVWCVYILYLLTALVGSTIHGLAWRRRASGCLGEDSVEVVFVSKASTSVLGVLLESIRRTRRVLPRSRMWVVVDEGSEGLPVLERFSRVYGYEVVVVPAWYRRGKFKARAINYFIEKNVVDDHWYVFLDDDSYPVDASFLCQVTPAAEVYNGVLYPRRGRSLLAWLADFSRHFFDIAVSRFMLRVLGRPLAGLHGELLIVRGSVLRRIGFETDSVVEDAWFASRLVEEGYRASQVDTRVSILSPNSVIDLWRQRSRWYAGWLRELVRGGFRGPMRLIALLHVAVWSLAPIGALLLIAGLAGLVPAEQLRPPSLLAPVLNLGLLLLALTYTIYPLRMGRPLLALLALATAPILVLVEALSTLYAWLHLGEYMTVFRVIDKSIEPAVAHVASLRRVEEPLVATVYTVVPGRVPHIA